MQAVSVRRISQPKLLSLREGETRGRKGGGETEKVMGRKVPESVDVCVHVYANCESVERTEEPFREEGNNIDNKQENYTTHGGCERRVGACGVGNKSS